MKYKCLSIAGFDGSGGAGIQADLKTFSALGCYGMTVLTVLPVQNTQGVRSCYSISLKCIQEQLEAIFDDIRPDSIKIGALFSSDIIELIADFLRKNAADIPIVLDPVMIAKSGNPLLLPSALAALKKELIPITTILTPNIPEGNELVGKTEDFDELAEKIMTLGAKALFLKGGHSSHHTSDDLYIDQFGSKKLISANRIVSKNTHGTGCTLSSAICAYIARGHSLVESCELAKKYLYGALVFAKDVSVGKGNGPVDHLYQLFPEHSLSKSTN